jgi:hypothetical protein
VKLRDAMPFLLAVQVIVAICLIVIAAILREVLKVFREMAIRPSKTTSPNEAVRPKASTDPSMPTMPVRKVQ